MYIRRIIATGLFSWKKLDIDFDINTSYSFKGMNGAGKSSIFEIVKWALFKKSNKKTIKNYGDNGGTVSIYFSTGDILQRYTASPTDIKLNNKEITQEQLEQFLGCSYTTFMSAIMCDQKRVSAFVNEETGSGKAKIFGEMIGAAILDGVRKKVQDLKNEHEIEYEGAKSSVNTLQDQVDEIKLQFGEKSPKEYKNNIDELTDKINVMIQEQEIDNKHYQDMVSLEERWKQYEVVQDILTNLNERKVKSIEMAKELKDKITAVDIGRLNQTEKEFSNKLQKLEDEDGKINIEIAKLETAMKPSIELVKSKGKCPTCGTQITDNETIKIHSKKIQSHKNSIEKFKERCGSIEMEMSHIKEGQVVVQQSIDEYNNCRLEYKGLVEELKATKAKLVSFSKIDKPKEERPNLNYWKDEINDMSERLFKLKSVLEKRKNILINFVNAVKKLKASKENIKKFEDNYFIYKWLFEHIPIMKLRFIDNSKVLVESLINENISNMGLPFTVKIATQRELSKGNRIKDEFSFKIMNTQSNKEANKKDLSGGEEICILLATQFAINTICNTNLDFEMYDEIYGSLDDRNIAAIVDALKDRTEKKQIFSISHKDEISNSFDNVVHIIKNNGQSEIKE